MGIRILSLSLTAAMIAAAATEVRAAQTSAVDPATGPAGLRGD
jgi:hypothetical protein